MAKTKKAEALTLEEKLQQALVPQEEQPYKVPENWCWVKFGTVCKLENGYAFKSESFSKKEGIPLVRISNINNNIVDLESCVYTTEVNVDDKYFIENGDLLIAMSGATTGKNGVYHSDRIAYLNQRVGNIKIINKRVIIPLFRNLYILNAEKEILNMAYGGAQPNISSGKICDMFLPLPPLPEQQRIVECIESLFAKLDEAKEKAQEVVDGFEERKAAILHKAFTGELTAKWRAEHGIGMDSWEEKTLESVCNSIFDGDHMPPPKSETGVPFLVISNVNTGYLSFDNTRFVPESYFKGLSNSRKPEYGDVLYTIVGSYGIPVIVDSDKEFCFQRHIALLKPKSINSYYLWYCLQSREVFNKVTDIATGTAQLTVPIKGLRKIKINCASFDEQVEIVNIVNDMFVKEQLVKRNAESTIKKIELIKKSILAKAFRGELGTNNPEEESSIKALKECL